MNHNQNAFPARALMTGSFACLPMSFQEGYAEKLAPIANIVCLNFKQKRVVRRVQANSGMKVTVRRTNSPIDTTKAPSLALDLSWNFSLNKTTSE